MDYAQFPQPYPSYVEPGQFLQNDLLVAPRIQK